MSSSPKQMVSAQVNAIDLLSRLVDQLATTTKTSDTNSETSDALPTTTSEASTLALHSSTDSHCSTEVIQISDIPNADIASTSAILHYCKRKVLVPYLRFLSVLGWRPIIALDEDGFFSKLVITIYTVIVILFTLLAYVLQYAACFRRDVVVEYEILNKVITISEENGSTRIVTACQGKPFSTYIVPDVFHLTAYIYMYYLIRIRQTELLQVLMERGFLQAFYSRTNTLQPKIIQSIRLSLAFTITWLMLSIIIQVLHVDVENPRFTWMEPFEKPVEVSLIVLLILTAMWTDLIHIAIIVSYSIQCQLLNSIIRGLCEQIREKSITLEEAIKEMGETVKIITYLNNDFAIPVSLMMLHSGMMTVSGLVWGETILTTINDIHKKDATVIAANSLSIIMWMTSFSFPLIQAARLTAACQAFHKLGQYLMTRPFGYQETPLLNLQSFLSYTTSLKLQAKLFRIPIKPWVLFALLTIGGCVLLVLFRSDVIKLSI